MNQTANPGRLEAERQLENLRDQCLAPGGGLPTMKAMHLCAIHRLNAPAWLLTEFARRTGRVLRAEAGSWDAAFGRPWRRVTPDGLQSERDRLDLCSQVYDAVWKLALEDGRAINADLFKELATKFGKSRATLVRRYREAVLDGRPSVAELRRSMWT